MYKYLEGFGEVGSRYLKEFGLLSSVNQSKWWERAITNPKFFLSRICCYNLLFLLLDKIFWKLEIADDKPDDVVIRGWTRAVGELTYLFSRHFWMNSSCTRLKMTTEKRLYSESDVMSLHADWVQLLSSSVCRLTAMIGERWTQLVVHICYSNPWRGSYFPINIMISWDNAVPTLVQQLVWFPCTPNRRWSTPSWQCRLVSVQKGSL